MKKVQRIKTWAVHIILIFIVLLFLFPIFWLISTAFKSPGDYYSDPPMFLPSVPTLDNFKAVLGLSDAKWGADRAIMQNIINSAVVALGSTALSMIIGLVASYGFVSYKFKGRGPLMVTTIVAKMLPTVVVCIPVFLVFSRIGLVDNQFGLMLSYMVFNLPFVIWMMKGFLEGIPKELEEAARIDGCSKFGAFIKIILPLAAGGLAATSIFCLIFSWNEFILALILTNSTSFQTVTIAISGYITDRGILWGEMSAVGTIALIPMMIFILLVQKHMVEGLTFGAVKE